MMLPRSWVTGLVLAGCLAFASPASADLTAFVGLAGGPSTRLAKGVSVGVGFVIAGVEFEYADTGDDVGEGSPHLRTFMVNGLVQTPVPVLGMHFYGTVGGGGYHEDLAGFSETSLGVNLGGGVKLNLVGPLRLRADYRVFKLAGSPLGADVVHRVYVGVNVKF